MIEYLPNRPGVGAGVGADQLAERFVTFDFCGATSSK